MEFLLSPSFVELHCSRIAHMNQMEPICQDLLFLLHQEDPQNPDQFGQFRHGVEPTSWCLLRPWFRLVQVNIHVQPQCTHASRMEKSEVPITVFCLLLLAIHHGLHGFIRNFVRFGKLPTSHLPRNQLQLNCIFLRAVLGWHFKPTNHLSIHPI